MFSHFRLHREEETTSLHFRKRKRLHTTQQWFLPQYRYAVPSKYRHGVRGETLLPHRRLHHRLSRSRRSPTPEQMVLHWHPQRISQRTIAKTLQNHKTKTRPLSQSCRRRELEYSLRLLQSIQPRQRSTSTTTDSRTKSYTRVTHMHR